ncbi:hypothetical protein GCM10027341_45050 [Spirosoma knui]
MKIVQLDQDLDLICVTATSFPTGIRQAFKTLESSVPEASNRPSYGLSKPDETGVINYKAGVPQAYEGEAKQYGHETVRLTKGDYLTVTIRQWQKQENSIGLTFRTLLDDPRLDPASYCVEHYDNEDVTCMVKLIPSNHQLTNNNMQTLATPVATQPTVPKSKTLRITYWVLTSLFALAMLMDGIAGVMQEKTGQEVMRHLGFPMYVLIIFGTAKILGVLALVQPKFNTLKEWAYAGFAINFIGAFASRAFVGDEIGLLLPPLVMLGIMFLTYSVWKRFERANLA